MCSGGLRRVKGGFGLGCMVRRSKGEKGQFIPSLAGFSVVVDEREKENCKKWNSAITIGFGSLWRAGLDKQASFLMEVGISTSRYSYFLYGYLATIPLGSAKRLSASGSSTVCSSCSASIDAWLLGRAKRLEFLMQCRALLYACNGIDSSQGQLVTLPGSVVPRSPFAPVLVFTMRD